MSEKGDTEIAAFLKNHPRMMGVLFMALLLLGSGSGHVAGGSQVISGP